MRNGLRVFDADLHIIEPVELWQDYITPEFRDRAPRLNVPGFTLTVEGVTLPTARPGTVLDVYKDTRASDAQLQRNFSPQAHLAAMDIEGVDQCALYPTLGLLATCIRGLDPPLAYAIAAGYNDWLADYCAAVPDRLLGVAMLPLHDTEMAIRELRRAVENLGMRAVFINSEPVIGKPLHDPYYVPIWAEVERLGVGLAVHGESGSSAGAAGEDRFGSWYVGRKACGFPMEEMMAALSFIMGGVLERHPGLRVAFLESGSAWAPYWLWRLDEIHHHYGRTETPYLTLEPSDYFRRQCFISVEVEEPFLDHVRGYLGDGCLLTSTDYPHTDSKYPNAIESFLALPLAESSQRKILWDNPRRLYGFK
jgi:predicted TIM-barrel fold metal-dependent hydrolase